MIPIFFTFDNNYSAQCGVTVLSILENKYKDVNYAFYVISDYISDENKNKLESIVDNYKGSFIKFINGNECINFDYHDKLQNKKFGDTFLTKETMYRCYPDLIPEFEQYDKIIYSDVDIVVLKDISELYDIDIEDNYILGCKTPYFLHHEITHIKDEVVRKHYIAGGLWIMNLKKFREDKMNQKITELINDKSLELVWIDQDIMNTACQDKVKFLPYKYISIPDWWNKLDKSDYKDKYYQNDELKEITMNPSIIHYAGVKPWVKDTPAPRLYELWFYWVAKTPFADMFKEIEKEVKRKNGFCTIKVFGVPILKNIPTKIHDTYIINFRVFNIPVIKVKKSFKKD